MATGLLIPLGALPSAAAPPTPTPQASPHVAVAAPTAAVVAPAPASEAIQGTLDDGSRTVSFNDGWRFALVNSEDITDPTGCLRECGRPHL